MSINYSDLIWPKAKPVSKRNIKGYNREAYKDETQQTNKQNKKEIDTSWIPIGVISLKSWGYSPISINKVIENSGDRLKNYQIVPTSAISSIKAEKGLNVIVLEDFPGFIEPSYKRINGNEVIFRLIQTNKDGSRTRAFINQVPQKLRMA